MLLELALHVVLEIALPATGYAFLWCASAGRATTRNIGIETASLVGVGCWVTVALLVAMCMAPV